MSKISPTTHCFLYASAFHLILLSTILIFFYFSKTKPIHKKFIINTVFNKTTLKQKKQIQANIKNSVKPIINTKQNTKSDLDLQKLIHQTMIQDELANTIIAQSSKEKLQNPIITEEKQKKTIEKEEGTIHTLAYETYRAKVYQQVLSNWHAISVKQKTTVTLLAHIGINGNITNIEWKQKSDLPALNLSIKNALLQSSPFPSLSDELQTDKKEIVIHFNFTLYPH